MDDAVLLTIYRSKASLKEGFEVDDAVAIAEQTDV
jgi:hypothetical protein